MNYTVNWSSVGYGQGEVVPFKQSISIPERSINSSATSLRLTGKGLVDYGEIQQQNYIKLLENFASTTAPPNPTIGQLWYDVAPRNAQGVIVSSYPKLKVCRSTDGSVGVWDTIPSADFIRKSFYMSDTEPQSIPSSTEGDRSIVQGDIWLHTDPLNFTTLSSDLKMCTNIVGGVPSWTSIARWRAGSVFPDTAKQGEVFLLDDKLYFHSSSEWVKLADFRNLPFFYGTFQDLQDTSGPSVIAKGFTWVDTTSNTVSVCVNNANASSSGYFNQASPSIDWQSSPAYNRSITPLNNQSLIYNSSSASWQLSLHSLSSLSDTDAIGSASDGDKAVFKNINGSIKLTPSNLFIGDLDNVNSLTNTPQNNQFLRATTVSLPNGSLSVDWQPHTLTLGSASNTNSGVDTAQSGSFLTATVVNSVTTWGASIPALSALNNIAPSTDSASDGEVLQFNSTSGKWSNSHLSIADLSDVAANSSPSTDIDVLRAITVIENGVPTLKWGAGKPSITGSIDYTPAGASMAADRYGMSMYSTGVPSNVTTMIDWRPISLSWLMANFARGNSMFDTTTVTAQDLAVAVNSFKEQSNIEAAPETSQIFISKQIGNLLIIVGQNAFGDIGTNTQGLVSFPRTFASPPFVMTSLHHRGVFPQLPASSYPTSTGASNFTIPEFDASVGTYNVTTTSFMYSAQEWSGVNQNYDGSGVYPITPPPLLAVNWIAVGLAP